MTRNDEHLEKLKAAEDWKARKILIALCADAEISNKAAKYLDDMNRRSNTLETLHPKRKRSPSPELSICVQCEKVYSKAANTEMLCQYHNGELEPDYGSRVWADHDQRCHGTINSDYCRKEYPDGFTWTCCDQTGTGNGCRLSRHQSDPSKNKRLELDEEASEVSASEEFEEDDETEESDDDGQEEQDREREEGHRVKRRKM
ncbi:hypothetical protein QBC47DRAFT_395204 [Echria macrotheca]|uniref:C2H2-type domain-containing protein n=1 Tax=Echria macrotheca TaxID=438768 RepID=A0AAJ0F413_9PEZI|nr:hypothetical protein QBC47DRAFT_395204 [Echria macrotheca]